MLIRLVVACVISIAYGVVRAAGPVTVNFEDGPGGYCPSNGASATSDGFNFSASGASLYECGPGTGFGNNSSTALLSFNNNSGTSEVTNMFLPGASTSFAISQFQAGPLNAGFGYQDTGITVIGYFMGGAVTQQFSFSGNTLNTFTLGTLFDNVQLVSFQGTGAPSEFLLDNIVTNDAGVLPVPEPSSFVLLLAGLGILGFTSRKSRNGSR